MPKRRILAPLVCKDSANHVKRKIKVRETNFYFALKPWQNQYLYHKCRRHNLSQGVNLVNR